MSGQVSYRAAVKACHEHVIRLTLEGWSRDAIAGEIGYTPEHVSRIRARYGVSDSRMLAQFRAFEDALAAGLSVDQALAQVGWGNPASAANSYYRYRRPVPRLLAKAAYASRKARAA